MLLRSRRVELLAVLVVTAAPLVASAAGEAKLACEVTENGKPASGTVVVRQGANEVARGACGKPFTVPPGEHVAVVTLDGALDAPEQSRPFSVSADQTAKVAVDFPTGLLEVRITKEGRDTAGMAVIRKDGKQIGSLGSGVAAHLSAGSYEILARYRTKEQKFEAVAITAGQRTVLTAAFQ